MATPPRISPFLWFADEAEEAANYYVGIFPNSRVKTVARYGEAGFEQHRRPAGSAMVVAFELDGQPFQALNGGPLFKFNESVSFVVRCETQDEIDHYWDALGAGGDPKARQCGWLKDRYGLSWQVVPADMDRMLGGQADPAGSQRAMQAVMGMRKLDLAAIRRAYEGTA